MLFGNGQDSCMCRMGLLGLGTVASNAWIELGSCALSQYECHSRRLQCIIFSAQNQYRSISWYATVLNHWQKRGKATFQMTHIYSKTLTMQIDKCHLT